MCVVADLITKTIRVSLADTAVRDLNEQREHCDGSRYEIDRWKPKVNLYNYAGIDRPLR